jgi:hypothetical protein
MANVSDLLGTPPSQSPTEAPTDQVGVEGLLGPKPAQEPPAATVAPSRGLLSRFVADQELSRIFSAAKKAGTQALGNDPVGFDPDTVKVFRDVGLYNDYSSGKVSLLRGVNETLLQPIGIAGDFIFKSVAAGLAGGAAAIGQTAKEVVGGFTGDETQANKAKREFETLTNFLASTSGGPEAGLFVRPGISSMGRLEERSVGGLPKVDDFKKLADDIDAPTAEAISKQLYDEKGILPNEIRMDMETDVTISQDLLSGNTPTIYTGKRDLQISDEFRKILDEGGEGQPPLPPPEGQAALPPPPKPGASAANLADAKSKILSHISIGAADAKRPWTFERLYTRFLDDLNPVKVATKEALKLLGKKNLPAADNPYTLFRLTRGTNGKADHFLLHGTYDFNTYKNTGKGLKEILAPVDKDLDGFRAYIASRRAQELAAKDIETGFDLDAANTVVAAGKKYEKVHQELLAYQNEMARYLKDSGVLSEKSYKSMLEAHKDYVPFFRYMADKDTGKLGVGRGLGSKKPIKKIKGSELAVIDPLESVIKNTYAYLALAEKNAAGVKLVDLLKEARNGKSYLTELLPYPVKGKTKPVPSGEIVDQSNAAKLLTDESTLPTTDVLDDFTGRSLIERIVDDSADSKIIDAEFSEIIPDKDLRVVVTTAGLSEEGTNTIHIFKNGRRETYRVNDPDLLAAWRGLDKETANLLMQVLAVPARTLRAGAVLTPEFGMRNVVRDFLTAFVQTGGGIFSPIDTAKGLKAIFTKDQSYLDWLKGGGANAALVSMDRRYLQERLLHFGADASIGKQAWNVVTTPYRLLQVTGEVLENAQRLGEMKKLMRGKSGKAAIQKAAYGSREVTLDFARIGSKIRALNMITAFLNATIQGPDRLLRQIKNNPVGSAAKIAAGIMTPSALLWWANHDEEWYKAQPAYQRDLFWLIKTDDWQDATDKDQYPEYLTRYVNGKRQVDKGTIWRIPKPFELGVIFGSGLERTLDYVFAHNPEAFEGFEQSIYDLLAPNVSPTGTIPIIEQYANKSYLTGDPLISVYNEQKLPEYQYQPYTTETAKQLGQLFGAFPGMSEAAMRGDSVMNGMARALTTPVLIENYVRGWTGGLGTYALHMTDWMLRKSGVVPDPVKPADTLADIPFVKAFVVRYPSAGDKNLREFYDRNEVNQKVMNSLKVLAQEGDMEAARKVLDTHNARMTLDDVQKTLGEMAHEVRMINKMPDLTPQDKRQLIDSLYFQMITMATTANQMLDEAEKIIEEGEK